MSPRTLGILMLLAASVLWSISGAGVKLAQMHPVTFAMYRSAFAAAAMLAIVPYSAGRRPVPAWMAASIVTHTIVVTLLIAAMTLSTAAAGILLQYTGPVFCAIFAFIFQKRRISRLTGIAMVIAAAGISVMIAGQPRDANWIGPTAGLLSGAAFGALILLLEKIDRASGGKANPFAIVLCNNLGTTLLLLPIVLWLGIADISARQLAIVGLIGIVQLALPYVLFQLALRRVAPVDASLLILLEPVLNPVWVAMMTDERPDTATLIGGATILLALILEALKPREQEK
jgi:drug/metabolite transporter (DMT)-like permease